MVPPSPGEEAIWCHCGCEEKLEKIKNMFDDHNQTVLEMMKPSRKQDAVPSCHSQTGDSQNQGDSDRFNLQPAAKWLLSRLSEVLWRNWPQCSPRFQSSLHPVCTPLHPRSLLFLLFPYRLFLLPVYFLLVSHFLLSLLTAVLHLMGFFYYCSFVFVFLCHIGFSLLFLLPLFTFCF